jgi:hypothetical protein
MIFYSGYRISNFQHNGKPDLTELRLAKREDRAITTPIA